MKTSKNKRYKDKHRRLARNRFWQKHDKEAYRCPDCSRKHDEINDGFEVHHKNGNAVDNSIDNLVAVCQACHNIRENKKPSMRQINQMQKLLSERASRQYSDELIHYCDAHVNVNPNDSPWADNLKTWWSFYKKHMGDNTKITKIQLATALRDRCNAKLEYRNGGILIVGPSPV